MAQLNASDIFSHISTIPENTGDHDADIQAKADYAQTAADEKAAVVNAELNKSTQKLASDLDGATQNVAALDATKADADVNETADVLAALKKSRATFNLNSITNVWFGERGKELTGLVAKYASWQLNSASAAGFGTIPDNVVRMFTDSAATKMSGEARLEVADILDKATGVTKRIGTDDTVNATKIEDEVKKILKKLEGVFLMKAAIEQLYHKVLNRVVDYQKILANLGEDLAKKTVMLDKVIASLQARLEMVFENLFSTCAYGLGLEKNIEREAKVLADMETKLKTLVGAERGPLNEKIKTQSRFIQILIKRLVDLNQLAVRETGLVSVIGTIRDAVAVVKADVEFARTNLMALLGLQLGLVVEIVATLRVADAADNLREADADAAEKVGTATGALDEAANRSLVKVDAGMRALNATILAAQKGIQSTRDSLKHVLEMQEVTDDHMQTLFTNLGNA